MDSILIARHCEMLLLSFFFEWNSDLLAVVCVGHNRKSPIKFNATGFLSAAYDYCYDLERIFWPRGKKSRLKNVKWKKNRRQYEYNFARVISKCSRRCWLCNRSWCHSALGVISKKILLRVPVEWIVSRAMKNYWEQFSLRRGKTEFIWILIRLERSTRSKLLVYYSIHHQSICAISSFVYHFIWSFQYRYTTYWAIWIERIHAVS